MAAAHRPTLGARTMISRPEIVLSAIVIAGLSWFVWNYIADDLPEDFLAKWAEERKKAREARKAQRKK